MPEVPSGDGALWPRERVPGVLLVLPTEAK